MDSRKRALVGECISRASVEAARGTPIADLETALAGCDYERAATIAFACARAGTPVGTDVIGRILPGIELPAITCSLIAIAPSRGDLLAVLDQHRFPTTRDAAELETITLYAAWKAGAEPARVIPHLRRLSARSLTAESYALLATVAATIDDPNVAAATKPIAPFAKEYAKNVAADDKAMHASLDAVFAELPAEVEASLAAGFTVRTAKQVGRNDLCPCGSGLKFKKCCADKPQAAPSPIPGLSFEAFLAGEQVTADHVGELGLRDLVRIDIARVPWPSLVAVFRRFITTHEWTHAERVQAELVRRDELLGHDYTEELALRFLDIGDLERARPLIAALPVDRRSGFDVDLAIAAGPDTAYRVLVDWARKVAASTATNPAQMPDIELAYALLRAEPALGILAARACIGTMRIDDPETLLEVVEEARDQMNLPPVDAAWAVLDELVEPEAGTGKGRGKSKTKASEPRDVALAESTARIDQLERTLAATRAQLADATTRPAAELMRVPEASGLDGRVRELEALIREGNAERRELRKQLEAREADAALHREREDSPRARRATLDEPDDGFANPGFAGVRSGAEGGAQVIDENDSLEPGNRGVTLPRFERRFVDALGEVPAQVAAETMRTIGTLAAGDGFTWRSIKRAKDMPRQVLMGRVGIHHRLIFRVEDNDMTVLDLITREQLDTTLKRLRMNR